jgi:hypothetical protein
MFMNISHIYIGTKGKILWIIYTYNRPHCYVGTVSTFSAFYTITKKISVYLYYTMPSSHIYNNVQFKALTFKLFRTTNKHDSYNKQFFTLVLFIRKYLRIVKKSNVHLYICIICNLFSHSYVCILVTEKNRLFSGLYWYKKNFKIK